MGVLGGADGGSDIEEVPGVESPGLEMPVESVVSIKSLRGCNPLDLVLGFGIFLIASAGALRFFLATLEAVAGSILWTFFRC